MASSDPNKMDCPYICPGSEDKPVQKEYLVAGQTRTSDMHGEPFVQGLIKPFQPKVYPPDAPPVYMPQPTDTTSGDILGMGPVDPWAAGHVDWTPQAGMTGIRPVVDKYSITRYSTGEWRRNNAHILTPRATDKAIAMEKQYKKDVENAFISMDNNSAASNNKLKKRVQDLTEWKKRVADTVEAISDEISTLEEYRTLLKGTTRILMLPEAIAKECLELRTNRYEPDLVRDDAEQELIREVAIVEHIRKIFTDTLAKVEVQMENNKAAKSFIEGDWSDKMISLRMDKLNLSMTPESNLILFHPGVARWPENASTLEYWEHYCAESIRNCDEVRQESVKLRKGLMVAIVKGGQDLKIQGDRTNTALEQTIKATQEMCEHLEQNLKENLQKTADIENLIDYLTDSLQNVTLRNKLSMTRLFNRNYNRPNVENCRDEAQYASMGENKLINETAESLKDKIRQARSVLSELIKYRGDLEKDIACKRKSLSIDQNRCRRVRAHMPKPEEFVSEEVMKLMEPE